MSDSGDDVLSLSLGNHSPVMDNINP